MHQSRPPAGHGQHDTYCSDQPRDECPRARSRADGTTPDRGRGVVGLGFTIDEPLLGAAIETLAHGRREGPELLIVRGCLAFRAPAQGVASPIFDGWSIFIH